MAKKINLKTSEKVVPMIYAYTTPEIRRHDGWTKIGYTEQTVEKRLEQQMHTADVEYRLEWKGTAIYDDGSGDIFHDSDFHAYLSKNGIERKEGTEWFKVLPPLSKTLFYQFKEKRGQLESSEVIKYSLRPEQEKAAREAFDYFNKHERGQFLYNAKPRFGKTLTTYDLCKRLGAVNILIVTNRPAIANSWYEDYEKFLGTKSGYHFVSTVDGIQDRKKHPYVMGREEYQKYASHVDENEFCGCIEFISLQDLKGSIYFGGQYDKLKEVRDTNWDILVIDEAHEGVDTYKTDVAFDHIERKQTLHLSGTPFKALANDKFSRDAIYNWTYADEQKAKREFKGEPGDENPYGKLPRLNMFTYQMSEIIRDKLSQGIEINGETEEYAFDLNEFFSTKNNGQFVYDDSVDMFLDALTSQEKFPFSTDDLRDELKHTLWLLNRVDSAKALAKKLNNHPVFKNYEIVLAAGDGKLDEDREADDVEIKKAFDKVNKAIKEHDKTITLSVGQLTTGVTIPEWSAVLMLSSLKSPALYMQAAFRAQNPCLFTKGTEHYRKENAYVFDFDPARTLIIYEQIANGLSDDTSGDKGDSDTRKQHVRELLNFFPVYAEDAEGEMIELDAEKVLSIPRKLKSQEVVRRGFMSDYLFQNIGRVFNAPQEVLDILTAIAPSKDDFEVNPQVAEDLSINEEGEVQLDEDYVIGKAADMFGDKIYDKSEIDDVLTNVIEKTAPEKTDSVKKEEELIEKLTNTFKTEVTDHILDVAEKQYGKELSTATKKGLERKLQTETHAVVGKAVGDYKIQQRTLEKEREEKLAEASTKEQMQTINQMIDEQQKKAVETLQNTIKESVETFVENAGKTVVETVETEKREQRKRTIEDSIKDHLRGFSRTIPSFLMAYGDEETTLENFDKIIPDQVFRDVTSISLEAFRLLRDGGKVKNSETGLEEDYYGHLFDPVVFNDSVKEFMAKKVALANYFEPGKEEDIFDYIPPQKTNQIFTPKWVVKDMVNRLEAENPGCFDDPNHTFADLYMKSGMYITEIVKRLYQNESIKKLYPDDAERLNHIFAKQVYGLAPTQIIYKICLSYILGFSKDIEIKKHNIECCDALQYTEENALEKKLKELFPDL
ncbi:Superfamily II DNA or RNA helicase [Oribacterium sp. KHPX15]|uniref:DEAD/DEAH box helicase family protein n=1 Tax=Oribacterium sp. KHPX15 TaxID=1855342 RepID=UPI00089801F8|nr:DEAD/DEAH box helicase family protein [Oribacterium sp. KHPX15]SEA84098.1 Superfamily II DNA or RNA helicase [Oribacterium sp. KHPX15]